MNIIHVLEDFSFQSGGIRTVVLDLHKRLISAGIKSKIVTPRIEKDDEVIKVDGEETLWCYSHNLIETLRVLYLNGEIDIIHIHGVWMYPQYAAAKFAKQKKIPFLITPHGMYEPWLWTQGAFKKKLYFNLVVKSVFSKATCFHAITSNEAQEIQLLFPTTTAIEIPNLIDSNLLSNSYYDGKERYILYVGRLDPKKGIDLLIRAFANLDMQDYKLKIVGKFNNYKLELDELISQLGLEKRIEFLGFTTGLEKTETFRKAFVFVAPSHSEVVGMVNLEAAMAKTPVITTFQTGLKKEWSNHGGILVNPNIKEIESGLKTALSWSINERNMNGEKLYNFVVKNYSWQNRFSDWHMLYKGMLKSV